MKHTRPACAVRVLVAAAALSAALVAPDLGAGLGAGFAAARASEVAHTAVASTDPWFATDGSRFGGEYRPGIRFVPLA